MHLTLIRDLLNVLQEEETILATPEDALYFRSHFKKKPKSASVVTIPIRAQNPPPEPIVAPPIRIQSPPPQIPPLDAPVPPSEQKITVRNEEPLQREILNTNAFKFLMQKVFPQIPILPTIPSDAEAKKIANRWKTKNKAAPISILFSNVSQEQKELLTDITKAIDIYFGPAHLIHADPIENEKQWEAFLSSPELKLVIACDYTLWQLKDLMQHFKDGSVRRLKNIPLFLLPDLSLYSKDPQLKRSLWKGICHTILS